MQLEHFLTAATEQMHVRCPETKQVTGENARLLARTWWHVAALAAWVALEAADQQ